MGYGVGMASLLTLLDPFRHLVTTEACAFRIHKAMDRLEAFRFGYSDKHLSVRAELPAIVSLLKPLVRGEEEVLLLFSCLPELAQALDWESTETPVGYVHDFNKDQLAQAVKRAESLHTLLKGFQLVSPGLPVAEEPNETKPGPSLPIRMLRTGLLPAFWIIGIMESCWLFLKELLLGSKKP